ncbi:HesA/MoeB/ThiF family protein [Lutispora thermophila]|uniref:Molybdopterin or thiamine biosynthesis adenylyltransferase n=1 Tax=Lutispora thermophila DSM 19022 TaxID=1122184 RepID=A0A1M6GCQ5_9FIRM|nr:HesA/MoeB/ThiF family protein [Lutispora thermophila]SHJ07717.1 Molybdopterin or thiamine biosynthesis adenylyltransferase [Lutispora thermophila DSM 19022]
MVRYDINMPCLSEEENSILRDKTVAVVGCGSLGGYIIEMLGRLGVGKIIAVDGDVFEESDLNRQMLSNVENMGKPKALEAWERMKLVNPDVELLPVYNLIDDNNAITILQKAQVVVDALDNVKGKMALQKACEELKIPLVYGAISGWHAQITTIFPGDKSLDKIYSDAKETKNPHGNLSFTPALAASMEVSEVLKLLIGRGDLLKSKMLSINLLNNSFEITKL